MASSDSNKNWLQSLNASFSRFLETNTNWANAGYVKFLGGAALGGFFVLVPLLYADIHSLAQLTSLQLGLSLLVVLTCGVLTAKLGEQFVDTVMKGLGNTGV
ncbi:MAG: hypothetical protein AAF579_03010 [Cyanobacteria bacterium P01_C01_bin.118]